MPLPSTGIFVLLFFHVSIIHTITAQVIPPIPSAPPAPSTSSSCNSFCNFDICGADRAILSGPSIPVSLPICRRLKSPVGQIISTGEARVGRRPFDAFTPISRLLIAGRPVFPKDFIRTINTSTSPPSAVSFADGVPWDAVMALHKSCIILPINSWFEDGARRTGNECLSFRAIVSILTVTLTWDSNDDLDLFVVEPNGQEVFFQNQSEKGRLLKDANRRSCRRSTRMRGRETVVYRKGIMEDRGLYRVFVDHTTSCGVKAQTKWTLRVTLRGVVLKYVEGVSTFNFGSVIEGSQIQFTV